MKFRFSHGADMRVLLTREEVVQARAQEHDLAGIMREVWGPGPDWTGRRVDVLRRMPDSVGKRSAKKRRLAELDRLGWVQRSGHIYGLLPAGRSQVQPGVQPADEDVIPLAQAA